MPPEDLVKPSSLSGAESGALNSLCALSTTMQSLYTANLAAFFTLAPTVSQKIAVRRMFSRRPIVRCCAWVPSASFYGAAHPAHVWSVLHPSLQSVDDFMALNVPACIGNRSDHIQCVRRPARRRPELTDSSGMSGRD